MSAAEADFQVVPNRPLIVLSLMTATVMNALDTTIANVALPHIQGSVSASSDQITWVLTSYIVASAIMTPMTGWLAGRFGVRIVFLISIAGFTVASALCGIANSLSEIVGFRLLQGVCGAALIPLSQAILLSIYPQRQHGQAMAMWGMGAMLGPIMGPTLGGWLTQNYSWRWVFYINLPFGVLAFLGFLLFLPKTRPLAQRRLDFVGFIALSLALGALQLMLDRGQQKDWFSSSEIWIEGALALLGLWWVAVQTLTADEPFVSRDVLRDKNFVISTGLSFFVTVLMFSTLSLLPPLLENLMGYPVVTAGLVTAPRGFGTLLSMFVVGRLIGRVDTRAIMLTGLVVMGASIMILTHINLQMGPGTIVMSGLVQGLGVGMIFTPVSTVAFSTLAPRLRTDGAALYTLTRNLGGSVGISILEAQLVKNTQIAHANLIAQVRPDNPNLMLHAPPGWSLATPFGRAMIDAEVSRQASMVAYVADFRMMLILVAVSIPVVLLLRPSRRVVVGDHIHGVE